MATSRRRRFHNGHESNDERLTSESKVGSTKRAGISDYFPDWGGAPADASSRTARRKRGVRIRIDQECRAARSQLGEVAPAPATPRKHSMRSIVRSSFSMHPSHIMK